MIIIGLTGSVGMGKTTTAQQLRRLGIPVHEADHAVHEISPDNSAVKKAFPEAMVNGKIERARLGPIIFNDRKKRLQLEAILHPLVRAHTAQWLYRQRARKMVCLDIPLLYEGQRERGCDVVLVVTAPAFMQKQRVTRRQGMSVAKFAAILAAQWPDAKKRRMADIVIHTGLGKAATFKALQRLISKLLKLKPRTWRPGWQRLSR